MTNFNWLLDGSIVGLYLLVTMAAGLMVRKYVGKVEHFLFAGRFDRRALAGRGGACLGRTAGGVLLGRGGRGGGREQDPPAGLGRHQLAAEALAPLERHLQRHLDLLAQEAPEIGGVVQRPVEPGRGHLEPLVGQALDLEHVLQLARDALAVVDGDEALADACHRRMVDRDAQQPARRALDVDELVAEPGDGRGDGGMLAHGGRGSVGSGSVFDERCEKTIGQKKWAGRTAHLTLSREERNCIRSLK